ncbi:hypothetical protein D3C78_952750 [compost metagenome]
MPGFVQANGKNRRHCCGNDAAWGDPGEQGAFAPVQLRTKGRQRDVQRPGNELDGQQQGQYRRAQANQGIQVQARSQEDEQPGDQQHAEVLLEVQDLSYIHALHVRQPHAHEGDRQQSRLVHYLVGGNENPQHRRQRSQIVQILR